MARLSLISNPIRSIHYTDAWQQSLVGRLEAQFRLDADGHPMFEPDDSDSRLLHYEIYLFLRDAHAAVVSVKYYLDDETFIDKYGITKNRGNDFRQAISSFGDVEVEVTVRLAADQPVTQRAWLSNMLKIGHARIMTSEIDDAIRRIRLN